jgi:hypothetical protein|tara:strand:- start:192 stop:365 length:174 start_codon:yes stop_codon:yes gene_type:complete
MSIKQRIKNLFGNQKPSPLSLEDRLKELEEKVELLEGKMTILSTECKRSDRNVRRFG